MVNFISGKRPDLFKALVLIEPAMISRGLARLDILDYLNGTDCLTHYILKSLPEIS